MCWFFSFSFPPPPAFSFFFFSGKKIWSSSEKHFPKRSFKIFGDCQISQRRKKMQGWGIKGNFQPVLKVLGTASGTPPLSPTQKFTQPFKLADPREAERGWPRPLLANQEPSRIPPIQNKPAAPTTTHPTPTSLGAFEFLSHLPKPDFLFLRKKTFKIPPLKKKKKRLLKAA